MRCAVNAMDGTLLNYFQKSLDVDGVREGELQAGANERLADTLQKNARCSALQDRVRPLLDHDAV